MFKKLKKINNLIFIILLAFLLAGIFVELLYSHGIVSGYKTNCEEEIVSDINGYATRLSNQLIVTDYFSSNNSQIDNELDVAAELFGGRILAVSDSLNIVYDTYTRAIGKTAVLPEILNSFAGNNYSDVDWDKKKGTFCYVVKQDDNIKGCLLFTFSVAKEAEVLNSINYRLQIFAALLIIVFVIEAYAVGYYISRPIFKMRKSLSKIAAGDFNAKVEGGSIRNYEKLGDSVNDVLVRVRATEKTQQEFVSNVSHELKTPMTSMKVLADSLLMMDEAPAEVYKEFLTDIDKEIDRENEIIQDLLNLVKLENENANLKISLNSVNEIMNVVLKRVTPIAESHSIQIVYESYREISAEVDENKLIMALTNFVENAVKYNKEYGEVRVSLNSDANFMYIEISDTGIGIPEEAVAHIFERFYRVDKARSRETGGTGLGLSIAYEIIKLHKGEVKVYSKVDEGTTFNIRIPLLYRN